MANLRPAVVSWFRSYREYREAMEVSGFGVFQGFEFRILVGPVFPNPKLNKS